MTAAGSPGLFASLKLLAATVLSMGRTRLSLLANEAEEEKLRLLQLVGLGIATLFLAGLTLLLIIAFLTVALWEHRVVVLGLALAMCALIFWLTLSRLKSNLQQGSGLFRHSLAELDADIAHLKQTFGNAAGGPEAR